MKMTVLDVAILLVVHEDLLAEHGIKLAERGGQFVWPVILPSGKPNGRISIFIDAPGYPQFTAEPDDTPITFLQRLITHWGKGCDRRKKEVNMIASTELPLPLMPLYRSHKIVRALQIKKIYLADPDLTVFTFMGRDENETVSFTPEDFKGKPIPQSGWYMIVYADGYVSFSPADTFEEGNTLMVDGEITIEQLEKMSANIKRALA